MRTVILTDHAGLCFGVGEKGEKNMKKVLLLFLSLCMVFTLAACGGNTDSEGGDELTVCFASEPSTIDPALNSALDGAIMLHHSFEGLLKWVDDGEGNATLAPGMAESWDISEEGTVYTFHIRKGALWSDGEPVTAFDFEYAWKRLVDPETAGYYSYMLACVLNGPEIIYYGTMAPSELAAIALDESTFQVTLHTAIPYFPEIAAFPAAFPVRQDIIEANADQWTFDPATYIGNGPFMMSEWVHNSYIMMVQNPNYYGVEDLGPDSIKFALMDDNNAMLAAFNGGEIDFNTGFPVDEVDHITGIRTT
jgi:oligopeptide transport system substrate-binding protein